jgi:methylated-DNA-protein-cysteine methyltransferase-like protein
MSSETGPGGWEPVYRVVRAIPSGRVSTYGDVAALAGMPRAARQVGWALNALEADDDIPWHRVINAKGEISARGEHEIADLQRALLEDEGVIFSRHDRVDLESARWPPREDEANPEKKAAKTGPKKTSQKPARKPAKKNAKTARKKSAKKRSTKSGPT